MEVDKWSSFTKKDTVICNFFVLRRRSITLILVIITGKDAAGIALEAINYARDGGIDVVMIDTAGRMQDNEPLMRALAKVSSGLFFIKKKHSLMLSFLNSS